MRVRNTNPFHRLNLCRNPFGELTGRERAELAIVDIAGWREHLTDQRSVLQFIGPSGHGKTTHLLAVKRSIPDFDYVYLPEVGSRPIVHDRRPILIDEAQRLSRWQLRRVLSIGGPMVFGTHVDLSRAIERANLRPLTVDVSKANSADRLLEILNRRIEASRTGDGPVPRVILSQAVRLAQLFGNDIRAIEHFLYEQFQHCALEQATWPPATFK